jgi:uncharacterized protein
MPSIAGLNIAAGAGGGALVGLSSAALFLLGGQVTGISGFVNTWAVKEGRHHPVSWRGLYISALAGTGLLVALLGFGPQAFGEVNTKPWVIAGAGALVGFSTRLGNGCTSGHGLCGISRLSLRSTVATMSFMATGMAAGSFISNIPAVKGALFSKTPLLLGDFLPSALARNLGSSSVPAAALLACGAVLALPVARGLMNLWGRLSDSFSKAASKKSEEEGEAKKESSTVHSHHHHHSTAMHLPTPGAALLATVGGAVFGAGLAVSGMTNPNVVQSFLDPFGSSGWNPTLMFVMGCGLAINFLAFRWASKSHVTPPFPLEHHHQHQEAAAAQQQCKPFKDCLAFGNVPANKKIDKNLLVGSALFGVGWGLAGVCPGPGVVAFGGGSPVGLIFVPSMLLGMLVLHVLQSKGIISGGATQASTAAAPVVPPVAAKEDDKKPLLRGAAQEQEEPKGVKDLSPVSASSGEDSESDDEDG